MEPRGKIAAGFGAAALAVGGVAEHEYRFLLPAAHDAGSIRTPRLPPGKLPPIRPVPVDLSGEIGAGAASLSHEYGGDEASWRRVANDAACNLVSTTLADGYPPDEAGWASIVTDAVIGVFGEGPPVGSAPWRGLEELKSATVAAITGDSGAVDETDASDVAGELGCGMIG